jgi:branched-subunit amino acid transport protein
MSAATTTIVVLALASVAIKASGPVIVGGHELPPLANRVIALFAPALLAALVVVQTFATGRHLTLDARAAGLAAAAAVLAWRDSVLGGVIAAAAVTALLRLLF